MSAAGAHIKGRPKPDRAFADPKVSSAFDAFDAAVRPRLLDLRNLVLDVASSDPAIGDLTETLKWGQPAYHPKRPRIGTTLRLGMTRDHSCEIALYVPCQTSLIDDVRARYADVFRFSGNRAVLLEADRELPEEPLRHVIALALTYHWRKRSERSST